MRTEFFKIGVALLSVSLFQFFLTPKTNADLLYVVHGGFNVGAPFGGELGTIDLNTGDYKSLGMPVSGAGLTGLASAGNRLYASTSIHSLATMDSFGGLISDVAFNGAGFDPVRGDRINDLSTNPGGVIYASGRLDTVDSLFTVDANTAALSLIGALPSNGGGFDSIAFAPDGRLFAQETSIQFFDEVDPATGLSLNGIAGGIPGGALGLGFNPSDGLLYGSECCLGDDGSLGERIFSIDPITGTAVQLFDYNDGRRIHDVVFVSAIPEPATCAVLILGTMITTIRRRR